MKILIVDDAEEIRLMVEHFLQEAGYETLSVETGQQAIEQIAAENPQIAFVDLNLPDMTGLDIIQKARALHSECVFILITGYGSIATAVEAMKVGAFDYLTKPLNADELIITAQKAREKLDLINQNQLLHTQLNRIPADSFLTNNANIKQIIEQALVVAPTDATILITGESGTGKEVLAKLIHNNSSRKDHPFVTVNCSALSEKLLESELFGHTKGAFTGAEQAHQGYFEMANSGTIFLDEIGEVDQQIQVKLLNFLQDRTFSRVGDAQKRKTDVRIIAATNREMKAAVEAGVIREDFYYRLNVFNFHLSPLKERQEDIVLVFKQFLTEFAQKMNKKPPSLNEEIEQILKAYPWPGNIRELRNVAERVTILTQTNHLPPDVFPDDIVSAMPEVSTNDFKSSRRAFEIQFIKRNLRANRGNIAATARQIGLHPVTLSKKIAQLNIDTTTIRKQFD